MNLARVATALALGLTLPAAGLGCGEDSTTGASSSGTGGFGGGTSSDATTSGATATSTSTSTSTSATTSTSSGGPGAAFPVSPDNVFSIQYRNSSADSVTVWLEGSQPPCSAAQALQCDSRPNGVAWLPDEYSSHWDTLQNNGTFAASGTHFSIIDQQGSPTDVAVSNHTELKPGETLRIVPPIVGGKAEWYWGSNGVAATAGVKAWVTKAGLTMPASEKTLLYEYNLTPDAVWWDLSAVDGLNANATMTYEGDGCGASANCGCDSGLPKVCLTNIDAFSLGGSGCPYIIPFNGASTCPNPKFYTAIDGATPKPAWVVASDQFTSAEVSSNYPAEWNQAGSPSGAEMASAPSGDPLVKPAYHIWWSTNPVAQGWLNYLQHNGAGDCNAYGWAYDERKWSPGDSFDANGNPPTNLGVSANVRCDFAQNTYLNIDVVKVM